MHTDTEITTLEPNNELRPVFTAGGPAGGDYVMLGPERRVPRIIFVTIRPRDSTFDASLTVRISNYGEPECTRLSIGFNDGSVLSQTSGPLRKLPISEWVTWAKALCIEEYEEDRADWLLRGNHWFAAGDDAPSPKRTARLERLMRARAKTGPKARPAPRQAPRLSPEFLEQVAQIHKEAATAPMKALESVFPDEERKTLDYWVKRARGEGFLPPTNRRKGRSSE